MARPKKIIIDRFFGGKAEDSFRTNAIQFERADHLDIYSRDGRMVPYRTPEADVTGQTNVGNFVYGTDGKLYGLGDNDPTATVKIFEKSATNLLTVDWVAATNGTATGGSGFVDYSMFFEYNGAAYFGKANGRIGKYDFITPLVAEVDNFQSVTNATGYSAGYHFKKNDTAYFAYSKSAANGRNGLASFDGTTFVEEDFVLPQRYNITTLSEYGTYLAIVGSSPTGAEDNRVFFWDTIAASADFVKDIPEGRVESLHNVDGRLVALVVSNLANGSFSTRLSVYVYDGGEFVRVKQFRGDNTNTVQLEPKNTTIKYNQLFFATNFDDTNGIYRVGIVDGQWSLSLDRFATVGNTETFTAANSGAIEFVGDALYVVHTAVGTITRSDNDANFGVTAIYDTGFMDGGDKYVNKRLNEVSIATDNLPSGGSVVVKAATDGSTSFTTILTHDVDDAVKLVSTKINGFDNWSYIQFRVEIDGKAEVTELTFTYDERPNQRVS